MDDCLASLTGYGQRIGFKPNLREQKYRAVFCVDISTCALTVEQDTTLKLPQRVARGSDAATTPNRTYDFAKYVTNRESAFWALLMTMVQASKKLTAAVEALLSNATWNADLVGDQIIFTDGVGCKHTLGENADVVLTYDGKPLAEHQVIQDWLSAEQRASLLDGGAGIGACLITGEQLPIARLHPGIRFGSDKLVAHNEPASRYLGLPPSENFPASVSAVKHYTSALSRLMDTRREPASSMTVVKDVFLILWPHKEGVTHPIIPPTITVLRMLPAGPSKPAQQTEDLAKLGAAWRAIDAVSDADNTDLCMAILGTRMNRYVPFAYGHTTVAQLRAALQLFQAEFNGATFRQVAGVWINDAGEALDDVLYAVLWATLTGKPYPLKVTNLTRRNVHQNTKLRWLNAYNHRKGSPLMPALNTSKDFHQPPTREQYYDMLLWDRRDPFYLFGQLIDIACRLKQSATLRKDSAHPAVLLRNALGCPQRTFHRITSDAVFHMEKIRKKRRRLDWENEFNRIVMDYDRGGIGPLPASLRTEERHLVSLGYLNQRMYSEHLVTHWYLKKSRDGEQPTTT